jgi:hypothetical protein
MPTLEEYSHTELGRIEKERQDAILAKGGLPFLPKLQLGVTKLYLHGEIPKDDRDPNGNLKKLFTVTRTGETLKYHWSVNPRSPLYRELLEILPKAPVWLELIRTGESRTDTRYSLRTVE